MINGSAAFNNAVLEGGHPYTARISHNGTIINCDVVNCSIFKGSVGADMFSVGNCFIPYVEMEVRDLNVVLENKELKVEVGVYTSPSNIEWITQGYFTVTEVERSTVQTSFTAMGRIATVLAMIKPDLTLPASIQSVITNVQTAVRNAGYPSFTINTSTVNTAGGEITERLHDLTARELLEIVAGCMGAYLTEDNAGNVVFFKYNTSSYVSYNGDRMIQHPAFSDYDFTLSNIKVIQQEEIVDEEGTPIPEVSYTYSTSLPLRFVILNEYMASQTMFNVFCTNCIGLQFRPGTAQLAYGDPRIEGTDVIRITDAKGNSFILPALAVTHVIGGGATTTITAPASSDAQMDSSTKGPITQQLNTIGAATQTAKISASQAKAAAEDAVYQAGQATLAAGEAIEAADAATEAAGYATKAADLATKEAQTAQVQAGVANVYANSALDQLGIVEDIVGVLDLLSKNGDYQPTQDPAPQGGKWYFEKTGTNPDTYAVVNPVTFSFLLTQDTEIIEDKIYYTRSASEPYEYTPVEEPVVEELSTYYEWTDSPKVHGYYELLGIKEAIQNYVSSQLVVTEQGLWLKRPDSTGIQTKVLLSPTRGIVLFGPDGEEIGVYGQTAQIGNGGSFNIKIDGQELGFYEATSKIAYVRNTQLFIQNAVMTKDMYVGYPYGLVNPSTGEVGKGQWAWYVRPNGEVPSRNNLSLKWMG